MSKPAITCHVNDSLGLAARLMWDHDCGAVAVVNDDGKLVGMLTDRDICMAAYTQGRSLDAMLVNSAMASNAIAARAGSSISDVEAAMAAYQIRRMPVVDDQGAPIGMITMNDLARACAHATGQRGQHELVETLAAICEPRAETARAA
ncbi:MAG: CBS domain-containing protein [Deltaproteobacteria bacterium]|nr:CBS domain-containing protein [Deltaproteobacteria bacterium]